MKKVIIINRIRNMKREKEGKNKNIWKKQIEEVGIQKKSIF